MVKHINLIKCSSKFGLDKKYDLFVYHHQNENEDQIVNTH